MTDSTIRKWVSLFSVMLVASVIGCKPDTLQVIDDHGVVDYESNKLILVEIGPSAQRSVLDYEDTRELIYSHYQYVHVVTSSYNATLHKVLFQKFLQAAGCEPFGFQQCKSYEYWLSHNTTAPVPDEHQEIHEVFRLPRTTQYLIVTLDGDIKARLEARDHVLAIMMILDENADELDALWNVADDEDRQALVNLLRNNVVF